MQTRLIHTLTALAIAGLSTIAVAQDQQGWENASVPARVGRIALAQGNVNITGDVGAASEAALLNYPVTSHNTITTARGARTELRIGSTSIRLDGDSSLEVDELDDDNLRLRLNYGSASIRIIDGNVLGGFEVSTPQALLRMRDPGRMRIDAERQRDTTSITVFDGQGLIDAAGGTLPLRAGKRADVIGDDIDTGTASRDSFDDWALSRDQYQDRSTSARYVTSDMTGYEDLDRYGSWQQDSEYGALWIPQVDNGWVPYGDGRWTWVDPWGWTWVDNAPWGYAPFHYGRWVQVNNRWAWAPGRHNGRPVWAPALVGWVGGNIAFGGRGRPQPSQGWYPLSPRDRFTPGYRASQDQVARLNFGRPDNRRDNDGRDGRRPGLTVLPQNQFGQRGQVVVPRQGRDGLGGAIAGAGLAAMQPPRPPQAAVLGNDRRRDEVGPGPGGFGGAVRGAARDARAQAPQNNQFMPQPRVPVTIATPPPQLPGTNTPRPPVMPAIPQPRQPVTILTPTPASPPPNAAQNAQQRVDNRDQGGRFERRNDDRNQGRGDDRGQRPQFQQQNRPQPAQQPVQIAQPAQAPQAPQPRNDGRNDGGGLGGIVRGAAREARPPVAAPVQPQKAAEARGEPRQEAHRGGGEGRNERDR